MSKAREFYLNPKGTWIMLANMILDKPESHVHVIEKSAYAELERSLEMMMHENTDLRLKADKLADALELALMKIDGSNINVNRLVRTLNIYWGEK